LNGSRQADFRCGFAAGFFAADSFAGFLPAMGFLSTRRLARLLA
jgi:hypothetical protein